MCLIRAAAEDTRRAGGRSLGPIAVPLFSSPLGVFALLLWAVAAFFCCFVYRQCGVLLLRSACIAVGGNPATAKGSKNVPRTSQPLLQSSITRKQSGGHDI